MVLLSFTSPIVLFFCQHIIRFGFLLFLFRPNSPISSLYLTKNKILALGSLTMQRDRDGEQSRNYVFVFSFCCVKLISLKCLPSLRGLTCYPLVKSFVHLFYCNFCFENKKNLSISNGLISNKNLYRELRNVFYSISCACIILIRT